MINKNILDRFSFAKLSRRIGLYLSGGLSIGTLALPLQAAETIDFVYSPLVFSLPVASLETFATEGKIDRALSTYLGGLNPEQKAEFRQALLRKIDINPVLLSRFFNSVMGADILYRLGKGITVSGGINGKYALRGAIVSAAFDPDGLTLLNVLKKFPTDIQLQGELIVGLMGEIERAVSAAELLTTKMRIWTENEAKAVNPPVDFSSLPDLRKRGSYEVRREVWNLTDKSRDRSFYVNVYIPKISGAGKIPVIILSHGLASRPEDFAAVSEHLASYGYLVAAPQHPGSDTLYLKGMLEGYYRNIFDRDEFINRPKDLSFTIDELERRNAGEFQGRLDLNNVGVMGHSFGGYTVLAIGGAEIDFDNLEKDCQRLYAGLNMSLLLECRALELPRQVYNLRDDRVKAVFAANPVNRSIFGQKGLGKITIPVLLGSGSYDPAANPIFEQILPFTWLKTPDKYLAMVEGQAHVNFTELDAGIQKTLDSVGELVLPDQDLIGDYAGAISTAFFQVHIARDDKYRPFLRSDYAEYLGRGQQFKLDFIGVASSDLLAGEIVRFREGGKN